MESVLTFILGGGRGHRLYSLTKGRSKPAVPFAGQYRLIDFTLSNLLNSGLDRVFLLTQFQSVSLHRHVAHAYQFSPFARGFVEVHAAQQTTETADWYRGTADAVRRNLAHAGGHGWADALVLPGDQLYRMDYRDLVRAHREHHADVTIAVAPVPYRLDAGLGVVRLDEGGRAVAFSENPQSDAALGPFRVAEGWLAGHGIPADRPVLASMGAYVFRRNALFDVLSAEPLCDDFGRDVFPRVVHTHHVRGHLFFGYWNDLETVGEYHAASLALAGDEAPFDLHDPAWPVYTRMRNLPASRLAGAAVAESLVSDGCVVGPGAVVERSVLGVRSRVGAGVRLREAVLLGADRFETAAERAENQRLGRPDVGIGEGAIVERAVIDRNCRVGRGVQIRDRGRPRDADRDGYVIRDGVLVLPERAVVPEGAVI